MQKKVLALAVAGLVSGAAFAQSNVTVYGVVDAGFVNSSGGRPAAQLGGGQSNYSAIDSGLLAGSRIGFKGEEGLGNGLKAIFALEYYIAPDINGSVGTGPTATAAGGSGSNTRQSFVGLQHAKFGTLSLGRQYAFGYGTQVRNDAWGGAAVGALATANGAAQSTFVAGSNARLSNSVVYATPSFSGFSGVVGYAYGEQSSAAPNTSNGFGQGTNGVWTTGVNYANGPLNLDLGYQTRQNRNTAIFATATAGQTSTSAATGDSVNEWMVGGSYDFKVVKVFATYQDMNDNNGTSAQEASNSQWSVGASVPVFGNGKIIGSYAKVDWDRTGAGSSYVYALGYTHALSKRTTLYTAYNYANNDRTVVNAAGMVGATRFQGESNSTVTAGISHAF